MLTNDMALRKACRDNDTGLALALLAAGADPFFNNATALGWAAGNGNMEILQQVDLSKHPHVIATLLERLPDSRLWPFFKAHKNHLMPEALPTALGVMVRRGQTEGVQGVLEQMIQCLGARKISDACLELMGAAAQAGSVDCTRLLLKHIRGNHPFKSAVHWGVAHGNIELLNVFVNRVQWDEVHHPALGAAFSNKAVWAWLSPQVPKTLVKNCTEIVCAAFATPQRMKEALDTVTDSTSRTRAGREAMVEKNETAMAALLDHLPPNTVREWFIAQLNEMEWVEQQISLHEKRKLEQCVELSGHKRRAALKM